MASTYSAIYVHLIFGTKRREPSIQKEWMPRLHEYMGGIVRNLGGTPLAVGGVSDHVHLSVGLKPTHCLSDFVRDLKRSSSVWVNGHHARGFEWQIGYAALTLGHEGLKSLALYIAGQEEHHKRVNSRDELLALLQGAGIEPDMQFFE